MGIKTKVRTYIHNYTIDIFIQNYYSESKAYITLSRLEKRLGDFDEFMKYLLTSEVIN